METQPILADVTPQHVYVNDQHWTMTWFPASRVPDGKCHGSAGICETPDGEIVLISEHGIAWDLPAGRPEGDETWEETLRREMWEEACVTVTSARLLGFCRSDCVIGHEAGLTLVRSFWHARVTLEAWEPRFEINHRRLVAPSEVLDHLAPVLAPLYRRVFIEATRDSTPARHD
jgi:8-oxo-dGTP pyrophosphatase MutT (NUDIX family)